MGNRLPTRCSILILLCTFIAALGSGTGCKSTEKTQPANGAAWHTTLPACPCTAPDQDDVKLNDGWAKDKGNIKKYHYGAVTSYRSYPYTRTSAGKSGQQCCYDANGNLITDGSGAGTPDKVSTCKGEKSNGDMKVKWGRLMGHYKKDVKPWNAFGGANGGWKKYNQSWPPNNAQNCKGNKVPATE